MTTQTPGDNVPAALRHLLAEILLALRNAAPMLRGPLACVALGGAWGAFLYLTGAADALGRAVPWPISATLFIALVIITMVGSSVRRPDAFPHERAWRRARAAFLVVAVIALATCYMAFLAA